ncbi:antitoxin [Streptomyces sp. TRM49041]|uniref:antitoxin n=1 Tax=Streptomyces sp. TRM49041 TaxID=2603216 RepID=UPI0011EEE42C|nr:antitoxin [Streptomyces sp. TRM49041]
MSMMDKLKNMLKGHEHQAAKATDKTGDFVDDKTQGRYSGRVDAAQERLKEQTGQEQSDRRQEPPQH